MENEALREEKITKHYPSILNVPIELNKDPRLVLTVVEKSIEGDFINLQLNQQLIVEHLMLKRGLRFFLRGDGTLESSEELNTSQNVIGVLKMDSKGIAFSQEVIPTDAMLKNSVKEEGIALEEGSKILLEDNSYLVVGEIKEEYVKFVLHRSEAEVENYFVERGRLALIGDTNVADIKAGAEPFEGAVAMDLEGKVFFVKAENEMVVDNQGYVLGKPEIFYLDGRMLKEIENERFIVATDSYALVIKKEELKEEKVEEAKDEIKEVRDEAEKEKTHYLISIAKPEQLKEVIEIIESKAPFEVKVEALEKLNAELIIVEQDLIKEVVAVSTKQEGGMLEQKVWAEKGEQIFERTVAPDTKVIKDEDEFKTVVIEVKKEGLRVLEESKTQKPIIICSKNVLPFLKKNENYVVNVLLTEKAGITRLRRMLGSMIKDGFFIFLKKVNR